VTFRRIAIVLLGAVLAFLLQGLVYFLLETHTRTGRLGLQIIFYAQTMTDKQIADAIGEDPFRALRRVSLLMEAVLPTVGLIIAMLVACIERRIPGRMTALILAPCFFWNFWHLAFARALPRAELVLKVLKESGIDVACLALAVWVSIVVAQFLTPGAHSPALREKRA